jgi:CubicO group peptidase (beta-lactamase class C family)
MLKVIVYGFAGAAILFFSIIAKAEIPAALSQADFDRIDTYIETQLKEANIPGAALVIVEADRITHVRGFGVAGPDGRPVTPQTGFILGSVSKSFTALAVMQLVEAGQIDLDAPVQQYLPGFRVADPEASRQMKVRHLLNHTSGFSTYEGRTHCASRDISSRAIERRIRALRDAQLTHPVGKGIYYSNANYCVLGAIIEAVSGQCYEDYIQEHIFDPLNMTNSYTSKSEARQHGLATGYRYWFGKPLPSTNIPYPRGDLPAGFLISCANDMGHYLGAMANGGLWRQTRILSESGITQMHTPDKNLNYAMGWSVGYLQYTPVISHGGSAPNYHTQIAILPEYQRAFALLINAENWLSGPPIGKLCWNMQNLMLGRDVPPIGKAPTMHEDLMLLCGLLFCQVIAFIFVIRRIVRLRKRPSSRLEKKRLFVVIRGGVSFVLNTAIIIGMLWIVPVTHGAPFSCLLLYAPDAGWLLLISSTLAMITVCVSMGVMVFLIR